MKVLFFGNYIPDYPRVEVLKKALQENGAKVLECHTRKTGLAKYWDLFLQHQKLKRKYDTLLVGMGGYTLVWFAKLLTRKKVVFDAFVSQYLTNVEDRKKVTPNSLKAKYYSFLDKYSCKLADLVLLDTQAQIDYFVDRYKIKSEKFKRVFISTDDGIFCPTDDRRQTTEKFIIHWHGFIVPFYGLGTIIKAAKIIKDLTPPEPPLGKEGKREIEFRLITRFDSKYKKIKKVVDDMGLNNLKFYPETDYKGIARAINSADICLGIFGDNKKAQVVIPNKIYEVIACKKPLITARHKVLEELFIDGENILLCEPNSTEDLVQKIMQLYNNEVLRAKLSQNAYNLYKSQLTPKMLGKKFKQFL